LRLIEAINQNLLNKLT